MPVEKTEARVRELNVTVFSGKLKRKRGFRAARSP
jgi:hypothetical protein